MYGKIIYTLLNADADYRSALGVDSAGDIKIYPKTADQCVKRPYMVYSLISRTEDANKDERGPVTFNVQVDHYASTDGQAENLDKKCIEILDRFKGHVAGVAVTRIRVFGGGAGFSEKLEADRRTSEFSIKVNPY